MRGTMPVCRQERQMVGENFPCTKLDFRLKPSTQTQIQEERTDFSFIYYQLRYLLYLVIEELN